VKNNKVELIDLGLIDYQTAWDFQEQLLKKTTDQKLANKQNELEEITSNYLIFCEHNPVYTLGKSGKKEHLLLSDAELNDKGISYFAVNRGGDITHHAPGQLVVYPIFDLDHFFHDIHRYLRTLEEAVVLTLAEFGIITGRYEGYTGVWLDADNEKARKICAMGVKCSRWVTMHGLALNVNNDLSFFNHIVPCGIADKAVTSMQQELGLQVSMEDVKQKLNNHIMALFTSEESK